MADHPDRYALTSVHGGSMTVSLYDLIAAMAEQNGLHSLGNLSAMQ